jgi:MFS transporter, DHA3 family, macrolide efflux protein
MGSFRQRFSLFSNRNFLRLFLAAFASQLGTFAGMTGFTFYLLDRFGHEPSLATLTEMMYSLPTVVLFFLVGVVADRLDRQRIVVYCDWIRFALTLLFLAAVYIGWMPLIYAVLFVRSGVSKFFDPAQSAILQGILKEDEYTLAAGLNQMLVSTFVIFGSGIGAVCYWTLGIYGAIVVDACSFTISGLLIQSCKVDTQVRLPNGHARLRDLNLFSVFRDFRDGMNYILGHRLLLTLMSGFLILGVISGGFSVMAVFIMKYKLAPDNYQSMTALLGIVAGVGMLLGSVLVPFLTKRMALHQSMVMGFFIGGLLIVAEAFAPNVWTFIALDFAFSLSVPFVNIAYGGFLPRIVIPNMMGRVQGWIAPLSTTMSCLTLLIIAVVFPRFVSVNVLYYTVGGCILLIALYYGLTLGPLSRKYEAQNAEIKTPILAQSITE